MKKVALATAAAVFLGGCFEGKSVDQGVDQALKSIQESEYPDNSPDAAVKSWWHLKDSGAKLMAAICKRNQGTASPYLEKLSELSTDAIYNQRPCAESPITFDRQITRVEVQSDTRAVVTAQIRNTTPPDQGAALGPEDKKAKDAGEPMRYVLERKDINSGWKIAQVSSYRSYTQSWESVLNKPEPSNHKWVYGWLQ